MSTIYQTLHIVLILSCGKVPCKKLKRNHIEKQITLNIYDFNDETLSQTMLNHSGFENESARWRYQSIPIFFIEQIDHYKVNCAFKIPIICQDIIFSYDNKGHLLLWLTQK